MSLAHIFSNQLELAAFIRYQPVFGTSSDLDSLVWIWVLCALKHLTPHISVSVYLGTPFHSSLGLPFQDVFKTDCFICIHMDLSQCLECVAAYFVSAERKHQ